MPATATTTPDHPAAPARRRAMLAGFAAMHLACFAAIYTGVSRTDLAVFAVLYVLRVFGITAGYHRYLSHRAFKTGRVFQFILALLAQSSMQGGALWWAAKHRHHHRHTDSTEDVHSPLQHGFWSAHLGWMFDAQRNRADYTRVQDLARYPELLWLDRNRLAPGLLTGLLTWCLFGWSGLVVGFLWSTVALFHATCAVNSFAHMYGRRRYATADQSRNNLWVALFIFGEGWHNNHHHFMGSARQGFRWWELDFTYYLLCVLSWCGVVWDLRAPPPRVLQARLAPPVSGA